LWHEVGETGLVLVMAALIVEGLFELIARDLVVLCVVIREDLDFICLF
jgi:hypothetical protein